MDITEVFAPIEKVAPQDDGTVLVTGKITGPDLDLDKQRCDPAWLKSAVPKWFEVGNIREMHQPIAVGKATDLVEDGDDWHITAKVVDPLAAKKVTEGIYTGFSIGIKGARLSKSADAPNGLIVDGAIVETSLADMPCNPTAKLTLAKAAATGGLDYVEEVITIDADAGDPPPAGDAPKAATADAPKGKGKGGKGKGKAATKAARRAGRRAAKDYIAKITDAGDITKTADTVTTLQAEHDTLKVALEEAKATIAGLEERLTKVEELPAPGGPSRLPATDAAVAATAQRRAEDYMAKAAVAAGAGDLPLAESYRNKAHAALEAADA